MDPNLGLYLRQVNGALQEHPLQVAGGLLKPYSAHCALELSESFRFLHQLFHKPIREEIRSTNLTPADQGHHCPS
jgi:hypothetical protein